MLVIHVLQDWLPTLAHLPVWSLEPASLGQVDWSALEWNNFVLAQQFDTDVFAGVRNAATNFYRSGQLWALLAGMVIGYLLRSFTTYG